MYSIPLLKFVFDRKHVAKGDVEASIELRATLNYKQTYFATGIKVKRKQWHDGTIINRPDAAQLNLTLEKLMRNVREVVNEMLDEGTVSVFAATDQAHGVIERGMKYSIDDETLTNRTTRGLSNELQGVEAAVAVEEGTLFVFHPLA